MVCCLLIRTPARATQSGNFNGYGDLGSWVPAKKGAKTTPGEFNAIVGCNDCKDAGWALTEPAYLQTWMDDGTTLKLTKNVSVTFTGTPAAFIAPGCARRSENSLSQNCTHFVYHLDLSPAYMYV